MTREDGFYGQSCQIISAQASQFARIAPDGRAQIIANENVSHGSLWINAHPAPVK